MHRVSMTVELKRPQPGSQLARHYAEIGIQHKPGDPFHWKQSGSEIAELAVPSHLLPHVKEVTVYLEIATHPDQLFGLYKRGAARATLYGKTFREPKTTMVFLKGPELAEIVELFRLLATNAITPVRRHVPREDTRGNETSLAAQKRRHRHSRAEQV